MQDFKRDKCRNKTKLHKTNNTDKSAFQTACNELYFFQNSQIILC